MNIDDLTFGELKQIAAMFSAGTEQQNEDHGHQIAVLDRGFVYVGDCRTEGTYLIIENAKNVRKWGTKNGLGELAEKGPLSETVLDPTPTVKVSKDALKFLIKTSDKWHG